MKTKLFLTVVKRSFHNNSIKNKIKRKNFIKLLLDSSTKKVITGHHDKLVAGNNV